MTQDAREHTGRGAIRALVEAGDFEAAWRPLRVELLTGAYLAVRARAQRPARGRGRRLGPAGQAPGPHRDPVHLRSRRARAAADRLRRARSRQLDVAPYGQVEQEVLDAGSGLADFAPTHVLIAPTTADLALEDGGTEPDVAVTAAARRWLTLWETLQHGRAARVIQHSFVVPDETPYGHLAARLESSLVSQVRRLNARLAADAANDVLLVDCERLAARLESTGGATRGLWYATRQPVSHEALPVLALEQAGGRPRGRCRTGRALPGGRPRQHAVAGSSARTAWTGIAIGEGPDGEAYAAFQDYVGVIRAGWGCPDS